MHLRKLELIGFKSFAKCTEFDFVPGVTVIVGPNGSGKSNVTDAIRWVLGEQSVKTLRGAKMEDVIFAGSDSRKPIGYCEVAMTFGNENRRLALDFSEVTVTRRVYRSGESEYFLNKQPCRLKDIHELFMDTGIGRDTYSIIGQGRIDEILSNKSDERRAIFEDVAGIVKYKTRKREAEKKLADTEQNLVRIHDLIYQLEDQIEPLVEKVEIAHEFKSLQQELKDLEVGMYVYKVEEMHGKWQESCTIVKQLDEENVVLSADINGKEALLEELSYRLNQYEEKWTSEQEALLQVTSDLEKEEGRKRLIQERMQHSVNQREKSQEKYGEFQAELCSLENEKKKLEQRLKETLARSLEVQEHIHLLGQGTTSAERTEELHSTMQEIQEKKTECATLEREQLYIAQQIEEVKEKMTEAEQRVKALERQEQAVQLQKEETIHQLSAIDTRIEENKEDLEACLKKREVYKQKEGVLSKEVHQLEQKVTQCTSQLGILEEIELDHSGFFQGVKAVLQARDQGHLAGVHGAVSQLIHVPKAFEVSMETALGGAAQHIVVDNQQVGKKGILLLKKQRLGRATFLPLDVLQDRYISRGDRAQCASVEGFVGIASDLIKADKKYDIVLRNLLGLIVIAESLESATHLARVLKHRYRLVTLDGDVIHPGGSMSGGSRQRTRTGLIGRSRQVEELKETLEQHRLELEQKVQGIHILKEKRIQLNIERETLLQVGERLRTQQQEFYGKKREYALQHEAFLTSMKQLDLEIQGYRERMGNTQNLEETNKKAIAALQQAIETKSEQIEELQALLKKEEALKDDQQEKVTEWKVEFARMSQEKLGIEENVRRVLLEIEETDKKLQETASEMESCNQEIEHHHSSLVEHERQLAEKSTIKKQLEEELSELRKEREGLILEREARTKEVYKQRNELRSQETRLKEQEVRKNRLDVELQHFLQKLADDYEMSFERAKELYDVPDDVEEAEKEIALIKDEISALGEVQLGAIEEHERLVTRLTFLQKQEGDLLDAKKTLYEIVDKMETEMGNRFKEVFESVRKEFKTVFVQMFGGGNADLTFSEPDNLLETGIEIMAQPPGKKLTTLTLLSGGERALTALVLLFAILRVKPVPFCVFDEVEAALDEANLVRFNRYLRAFAEQTQFILISHRKQTMEAADVLYGVTMQESGVSQLVSVKIDSVQAYQEVAAGKDDEAR